MSKFLPTSLPGRLPPPTEPPLGRALCVSSRVALEGQGAPMPTPWGALDVAFMVGKFPSGISIELSKWQYINIVSIYIDIDIDICLRPYYFPMLICVYIYIDTRNIYIIII